jgi:formylglycine-generating enzyme required for sulfatase activity
VIILAAVLLLANGQVVLVPNKARAPRAAGKTRAKPKAKPQSAPAQATETEPAPEPVLPMMSFTVIPPLLNKPPLEKPDAPPPSNPLAWPELLGYEFEVIKADDHGRVQERRTERARFFMESLSGGVNLEMVEIPAGTFLMGSNDAELEQIESNYSRALAKEARAELHDSLQTETPQRMVKVTAFYLSKYEVTQAQWRAVAGLPKVNRELVSDPSYFKGGNRPVEQISWEDAVEFCERLSRATGRNYRLPTEAEWEYACRAGTKWPFSFGNAISAEWVNYNGKLPFAQAPKDSYRQQTAAVGSLGKANAFGVYDMHGNVWEWCLDVWHQNYLDAPAEGTAWEKEKLKDAATEPHVLRGGAWDSPAGEVRSGGRRQAASVISSSNIGFRVVAKMEIPLASK